MDRIPIIQQEQGVAIKIVESPLTIKNLIPSYQYQFQSGEIPEEATEMYNSYIEFLSTNEELATNETMNSRDDYIKGFQKALAMTKLWIDSIYLQNNN